uniref:Uncharacterized protein n=1 Tax=Glossina austeni TaxID=7395 RepID=A0A1A9URV4_GLOAU
MQRRHQRYVRILFSACDDARCYYTYSIRPQNEKMSSLCIAAALQHIHHSNINIQYSTVQYSTVQDSKGISILTRFVNIHSTVSRGALATYEKESSLSPPSGNVTRHLLRNTEINGYEDK